MKKLMSRTVTLACLMTTLCLCMPGTTAIASVCQANQQNISIMTSGSTYSWDARAGAISYEVVLTPRTSGSPIVFNTTGTSISLVGVPSGVYDVVVTAFYTKGASGIIIEDIIIT